MRTWCDAELSIGALSDARKVARPARVLLADPLHFDVEYAINPHMAGPDGALKRVDRELARQQWRAVRDAFESAGLRVEVLEAQPGLPDLVFCANPALPVPAEASASGRPVAIVSNMRWPARRREAALAAARLGRLGYVTRRLNTLAPLEGMGDGLWHPGRAFLWAGVGPRSSRRAWDSARRWIDAPIATLELVDPDFYHLDTALALLDEHTCLWLPQALSHRSRRLVERLVPRRIEADAREAREALACNACSPDGRHVLIDRRAEGTIGKLRAAGYAPLALDTGEFLKSGGSVFCMKLLIW